MYTLNQAEVHAVAYRVFNESGKGYWVEGVGCLRANETNGMGAHLVVRAENMKMKTLTEKRFFEWHDDDISVTLRNKSGSYGGGSEVLVVCMK